MPDHTDKPARKPLHERELSPFLLWSFNHTGHADNVDLWREATAKPTAPKPDAPTE